MRDYVKCIEDSVISTLAKFDVSAFTTKNVGVWVDRGDGEESKLCAIGRCQLHHYRKGYRK